MKKLFKAKILNLELRVFFFFNLFTIFFCIIIKSIDRGFDI